MLSQPSLFPRIMELGQALFFNFSPAVLKLPTSIVNVLDVDDLGQVWFAVRRPLQHISEFDREFEARLELYRKGKEFHMQVSGKGHLVIDPEEINDLAYFHPGLHGQVSDDIVLVKLKVDCINYYPHRNQKLADLNISTRADQPLAFFKTLQYIFKDVIPVFQSH